MREQISQAMQKALQGSRKIKITFKPKATKEVILLLYQKNRGEIDLPNDLERKLLMVAYFGWWKHDLDRTMDITLNENIDHSWFAKRISYALEKIEVVD